MTNLGLMCFIFSTMAFPARDKRIRRETLELSHQGYAYCLDENWDHLFVEISDHQIRVFFPKEYPFRPPQYSVFVQGDPLPCLTRGISKRFGLPSLVEELIHQYVTPETWVNLKKYLYQKYTYLSNHQPPPHRNMYREISKNIIHEYCQHFAPYQWSPGIKIISQLDVMPHYLELAKASIV